MKNKLAFVLVAVLVSAGLLLVAGNAAADTRTYANQAPEEGLDGGRVYKER